MPFMATGTTSSDRARPSFDRLPYPFATPNHLKEVFEDSKLEENSVIRSFQITAADGKT
jgi:hypothetical protein